MQVQKVCFQKSDNKTFLAWHGRSFNVNYAQRDFQASALRESKFLNEFVRVARSRCAD